MIDKLGNIASVFSGIETISFPVVSSADSVTRNPFATRGGVSNVAAMYIDFDLSNATTDLNPLGDQRPIYLDLINTAGEYVFRKVDARIFHITKGFFPFRLYTFDRPINVDFSSSVMYMPERINQRGFVNVIFCYA